MEAEALPQALLDSCHKPVHIRGTTKGPRSKVSRAVVRGGDIFYRLGTVLGLFRRVGVRWLNTRHTGVYRIDFEDGQFGRLIAGALLTGVYVPETVRRIPETSEIPNGGDQGSRVPDSMGVR